MRRTHTFSLLPVSAPTYEEVERLLRAAGHDHVFVDGAIDMMGLALVRKESDGSTRRPGYSRLRGRPLNEDGDIELTVEITR